MRKQPELLRRRKGTLEVSGEVPRERGVPAHGDARNSGLSAPSRRYGRLRPGPGLSREVVETHQRSRLQQATIELVATHGCEALTVRRLAKRARISSGTFYRHYRSTDDCLLSTFDLICKRASERLVEVGQNGLGPRRRLQVGIGRLFRDMAGSPQVATFMLRAAPAIGPAFAGSLRNSEMRLGAALEFCMGGDSSAPLHPLLLEGMVAGLTRIGRAFLPGTGEEDLGALTAEAVEWTISLCEPALPDVAVPSEHGGGLPAPEHRTGGAWEEAFGDERAMILAAAFRIARGGYHLLTVPRICREAGVSRREFNRHFEGLEDCFVSALEDRAGGAIEASARSRAPSGSWSSAVYEALRRLCSAIEDDRDSARVLFVEITAAGTKGIDSRDRLISKAARALRGTAPEDQAPSELAAEASSAAAWAVLRSQVQDENTATTAALPVLAHLVLAPVTAKSEGDRKQRAEDKKHTPEVKKPVS